MTNETKEIATTKPSIDHGEITLYQMLEMFRHIWGPPADAKSAATKTFILFNTEE